MAKYIFSSFLYSKCLLKNHSPAVNVSLSSIIFAEVQDLKKLVSLGYHKKMSRVTLALNLLHILLFFLNPQFGNAGCASIGRCCSGNNPTCSHVQSNGNDCYCDQRCMMNNDCCNDYADYCINRGENTKQKCNYAMH